LGKVAEPWSTDGGFVVGSTSGIRQNVIFVGLVLGMLVAVTNQTIMAPANPVIVADLGGIEHYSWIATSALLVSADSVPAVGKLSDIYGWRGL
jgi:MFS family permease